MLDGWNRREIGCADEARAEMAYLRPVEEWLGGVRKVVVEDVRML